MQKYHRWGPYGRVTMSNKLPRKKLSKEKKGEKRKVSLHWSSLIYTWLLFIMILSLVIPVHININLYRNTCNYAIFVWNLRSSIYQTIVLNLSNKECISINCFSLITSLNVLNPQLQYSHVRAKRHVKYLSWCKYFTSINRTYWCIFLYWNNALCSWMECFFF